MSYDTVDDLLIDVNAKYSNSIEPLKNSLHYEKLARTYKLSEYYVVKWPQNIRWNFRLLKAANDWLMNFYVEWNRRWFWWYQSKQMPKKKNAT